ncbi:MAG: hypothetical protein NVS4B2_00760 [Chloroflexota bacterium]
MTGRIVRGRGPVSMRKIGAISLGACIVVACAASGCGSTHARAHARRHTTVRPPGTPTIASQIVLARRRGPGFLDYCPARRGRAPAHFDLGLPGNPRVGGWCVTSWRRTSRGDVVTFQTHWDARRVAGRSGSQTWRYRLNRPASAVATRVAILTGVTGTSPP